MDIDYANQLIYDMEITSKGPIQGSDEWLKLRVPSGGAVRGRVGGSDMASLIGLNPYKTFKHLMQEKLGHRPKTLPSKLFCWFGLLMEEVAVKVFEQNYNTKVMCKDISLIDKKLEQSIYSPDGLCTLPVNKKSGGMVIRPYKEGDEVAPVLVEIKCPMTRQICSGNEVPIHYMPQLQAGLFNIDIAKAAIFIDNIFRFSGISTMDTTGEFNRKLHQFDGEITQDSELEKGYIVLTGKMPEKVEKKWLTEVEIGDKKIYDFGCASYTTMLNLLLAIRSDEYELQYLEPNNLDLEEELKQYEDAFGVIGWKQFDSNISLVYKDQFMIDKIVDKMEQYVGGKFDDTKPPAVRKKRVRSEANSPPDSPED